MPTCLAIGCANTTGKTKIKKSYFRIPRPVNESEKLRAEKWLSNLQIQHTAETFSFTKDKVVCEEHFHMDCYTKTTLLSPHLQPNVLRNRILVSGSIPTIFSNCLYDVINIDGTVVTGDLTLTYEKHFGVLDGKKRQPLKCKSLAVPLPAAVSSSLNKLTDSLSVTRSGYMIFGTNVDVIPSTKPTFAICVGTSTDINIDLDVPLSSPKVTDQPMMSSTPPQTIQHNVNSTKTYSSDLNIAENEKKDQHAQSTVKDPTICTNCHAFCSSCIGEWQKTNNVCPTCRVDVSEKNPLKKVIGGLDDPGLAQPNDPKIKSQIRRTRIKLLFEDFQSELDYLEARNDEITQENQNLRHENEELHTQLKEQETRYLQSLKRSAELDEEKLQNGGGATGMNADINTILKLSSKLQEVMGINDSMAHANENLKQELKTIRNEKQQYMNDITKLKEEQQFINSPQKYNRYAMVALQAKVENYEREVQQLKKALKRSDEYIEKLTSTNGVGEHDNRIYGNDRKSPTFATADREINSRVSLSQSSEQAKCGKIVNVHDGSSSNGLRKGGNSSASATLQSLVRNNDYSVTSVPSLTRRWNVNQVDSSNENSDIDCADKVSPNNNISILNMNQRHENRNNSMPSSSTDVKDPDESVISNPTRFPASVKLFELSKARLQHDNSSLQQSQICPSRNLFPANSSSQHSPQSSRSSPHLNFASARGGGGGVGTVSSFSPNNNGEQPSMYHRENNDIDDITVVIPSTEGGTPWLHQPTSTSQRTDNYTARSKMMPNSCSSPWTTTSSSSSVNNLNGNWTNSRHANTSDGHLNSDERGFLPPVKKIKTEVYYE